MPDTQYKAIPSNMESMPAASLVTVHTGSMCCFTLSSSFFTNIASLITNVKIKHLQIKPTGRITLIHLNA